jgi:polyhydroxyalkanoate synthesis regulator phasin
MILGIIFLLVIIGLIAYFIVDVQRHKKTLIISDIEAKVKQSVQAIETKAEVAKQKATKKTKAEVDRIKKEVAAKVAEVEAKVKKQSKKVTKNK